MAADAPVGTVSPADSHEEAAGELGVTRKGFFARHGFVWGLLVPVLVFFIVFNAIPLLWMVGLSFYRYILTSGLPPLPVGLENYRRIMADQALWGSFSRTLGFMLLTVAGALVLGLLLGFLFWGSAKMPGRRVALTLLFTPMLLTPAAVGAFYRLMLNPNFGIISWLAQFLTGQREDLLAKADTAFLSVLLIDIWMWTPFMTMITLAALASVPKAELEAAKVDRLGWWTTLRRIIIPHAKFILMLGILLRTIDAFKTTDQVLLLTSGGPGSATELLGLRLYRLGFDSLNMSMASTVAVIALFVAIGFTTLYLYVLNLKRAEER